IVPQPDPIAAYPPGSGILRYDDNETAYNVAEVAARAFAGDQTGFPDIVPHGLQPICSDPGVNRPRCCDRSPACDLNILPARQLPFDPVIFLDGIEIPEIANNAPLVKGAGTFGRCSLSLTFCRVGGDDCPATESCAAITAYIVDPAGLNPANP